jgi:predicted transcriptional regulator of viral defense system
MVRRHISNELKETALSMSLQGVTDTEIREYTGISERSVMRLRSTYRNTGAVSRLSPGRFRVLSSMEAKVCGTISRAW